MDGDTSGLDARIWQAVIAGLFIGLGWFVNGWLNRRAADALKREKLRDMHRAIYAEIGVYIANIWDGDAMERYADAMTQRMSDDADFVPLIPREQGDAIFSALIPDVHVLPRQTIDPIVAFYTQQRAISTLVEDMRGDAFRAMSQDRRIAMYRDYIEMKKQALEFGRFANAVIDAYGKGGVDAAESVTRDFNSPAEDPSGRSPGSV